MLYNLKNSLKKIPAVYDLNAWLKAKKNTRRSSLLYQYYYEEAKAKGLKYDQQAAIAEVRKRLNRRGIRTDLKERPLRIFWVGSHYAQDNSGFLQALNKLGTVVNFTNEAGQYGLAWPQANDGRLCAPEIVEGNSTCLMKQIMAAHKESPIDLLVGQMWANVLSVEALIKVQQIGIVTVNVSMDDKLPELWSTYCGRRMGSVGLVDGLDLVVTTSPDTCLWYAAEGCPAIYWPLASDPDLFYPRGKKIYDVVFVGGKYGTRAKLVSRLLHSGIKVDAFGPGWPNGYIDAVKIAEVFGTAKIILGSGYVGYNTDIFTLKLRDFDATMAGGLYITNRNPDLLQLFTEGSEIECYSSFEECEKKIKHYLANDDELKSIAEAGLRKARSCFTWEKQIGAILDAIGFTGN